MTSSPAGVNANSSFGGALSTSASVIVINGAAFQAMARKTRSNSASPKPKRGGSSSKRPNRGTKLLAPSAISVSARRSIAPRPLRNDGNREA